MLSVVPGPVFKQDSKAESYNFFLTISCIFAGCDELKVPKYLGGGGWGKAIKIFKVSFFIQGAKVGSSVNKQVATPRHTEQSPLVILQLEKKKKKKKLCAAESAGNNTEDAS